MSLTFAAAALQIRYSFGPQYVAGAVALARRARELERESNPTETQVIEHRALIVGAVLQSVAAIEADFAEVCMYGPRHHLGGPEDPATKLLSDLLEGQKPLRKRGIWNALKAMCARPVAAPTRGVLSQWNTVIDRLGMASLDLGRAPCQDAQLLVNVRNELTHYRSRWNGETQKKVAEQLRKKRFKPPAFLANTLEWPQQALCADLGDWSSLTAAAYLDAAYDQLGVEGVLDRNRAAGAALSSLLPARGARWVAAT